MITLYISVDNKKDIKICNNKDNIKTFLPLSRLIANKVLIQGIVNKLKQIKLYALNKLMLGFKTPKVDTTCSLAKRPVSIDIIIFGSFIPVKGIVKNDILDEKKYNKLLSMLQP